MIIYFIVAAFIFGLDRITKSAALTHCMNRFSLAPGVALKSVFNRGVSWSLLSADSDFFFMALTFALIGIIVFLCVHTMKRFADGHPIFGEVLILSGSVSNVYDRFVYRGVVDFIELSCGRWAWPVFNVADVAIVLGVGIMLWQLLRDK